MNLKEGVVESSLMFSMPETKVIKHSVQGHIIFSAVLSVCFSFNMCNIRHLADDRVGPGQHGVWYPVMHVGR